MLIQIHSIHQVIMATNRIGEQHSLSRPVGATWMLMSLLAYVDILDPGLLRPGRIDRKIEFPPPNPEARVTILRIHSRKVSFDYSTRPAIEMTADNLFRRFELVDVTSTRNQLPLVG
jgi:hypothetical protein